MPITITKTGSAISSSFVYGPEHQRTRQSRGDMSVETYAGAQEVETTAAGKTIRTYWPYGVGVEIDRPGKTTELNWMHRDRLGSIVLITGQTGAVVEKMAYDAWGKRRALDGTNSTPDTVDGKTDNKGFTGHEMLDQLDLVHMNGRVYDPSLARFLSADPYLNDPTNGQGYNRYSYVLNNPTNFTDPTGFTSVVVPGSLRKGWKMNQTINNVIEWSAGKQAALERQAVKSAARLGGVAVRVLPVARAAAIKGLPRLIASQALDGTGIGLAVGAAGAAWFAWDIVKAVEAASNDEDSATVVDDSASRCLWGRPRLGIHYRCLCNC